MKKGDIVKKTEGDLDVNKTGMIINIEKNKVGTTIATVLVEGKIKVWSAAFLEVIYDYEKTF